VSTSVRAGRLLAADVVDRVAQMRVEVLAAGAGTFLQPQQQLGDDQRVQPAQADLAGPGGRRRVTSPRLLVEAGVGMPGLPPPLLVGVAVRRFGPGALAGARRHRARPARRQRMHPRIGDELRHR
jgi:hypothetical protein